MNSPVPEGWEIKPLFDLAIVDRASLKNSTKPDYRFRYIDIASVKTGEINIPSEHITFSDAPSRARKQIKKGDVLMSTVRPNLQAFAYFNEEGDDFVASTGFAVITANNFSDARFIYQSILSDDVSRQIAALVAGSNYPAISSSNVKNLEIITPPLPEQQKIASILSSVDNVIETTRAQIDKLKVLKTGMMQELLTKGIGHTEFKDSPVGRIPSSWRYCKLGTYLFEHKVKTKQENEFEVLTSSREGLMKQSDYYGENRLTRRSNIGFNVIPENHLTYRSRSDDNTFTFNINKLGLTGIVSKYYPVFTCESSNGDNDFFYYLLNHYNGTLALESVGTSQVVLSFNSLISAKLPIPPTNEQEEIKGVLLAQDNMIDCYKQKLQSAVNLKKALMQDLLTGKVRVNVDNYNNEERVAV